MSGARTVQEGLEKVQAFATAQALAPGMTVAVIISIVAWFLGGLIPIIGAPVMALAGGLVLRNAAGTPATLRPGVDFTLKKLLRLAIILFGATLSFAQVIEIGAGSFAIIFTTILLALSLTYVFGRWLQAPGGLVSLIGVGTAICGATAIITVGPIIESREEEIAFAVTTIFLFNVLAVVIYPLLGHGLVLSDRVFGIWAGTAIHDTSSVLAASFAFSEPAGKVATVVKLARTLMLVPLALAFGLAHSYAQSRRGATGGVRVDLVKIFPWFILWFVVAALLNTAGLFSGPVVKGSSLAGKFLVIMVMAAVGLAASVMIAIVSIALIRLLLS